MTFNNSIVLGPLLGIESDFDYTICVLMELQNESESTNIKLAINNQLYGKPHTEYVNPYYFLRFEVKIEADPVQSYPYTYQLLHNGAPLKSGFNEDSFTFWVSSKKRIPKVAFVSCCGFHNKAASDKANYPSYAGWDKLLKTKVDLLVLTGDQIYADRLWKDVPAARKSFSNGLYVNDTICKGLDKFYLEQYINSWQYPAMAKALATIPNIMSWDDHDIIDGYGSHDFDRIQNTDLFKAIFDIASKYYLHFQLRTKMNKTIKNINHGYTASFTFRNFTFILPDTRSHRTRDCIIGKEGYSDLKEINNKLITSTNRYYGEDKNMNVICFVLPVPVAHRNFNSIIEQILSVGTALVQKFWPGIVRISLDDDLVDHWDHENHTIEHQEMLDLIFKFGVTHKPYSIIIASGDVHSAGAASIQSGEMALCQLISSPIVNEPMSMFSKWISRLVSKDSNHVGEYTATELKRFAETKENIFNHRNFMTVCDDYQERQQGESITGLKPVINDDLSNDTKKPRSGKLIASLYLEPWKDKPIYRTINKFTK